MSLNPIVLSIPIFFILIGIEIIYDRITHRNLYRMNDAVSNISCGIFEQITGTFAKVFTVALYAFVFDHFRFYTIPDNWYWLVILFLGVDFFYYWAHRKSHEINLFWIGHVVHHQSEEYNLSVALRQGALQKVFTSVFYLPLALVGFKTEWFLLLAAYNTLYQFWIHTEAIRSMGPFEYLFNTPSHHRVHHGRNPKYIDKNHAGTSTLGAARWIAWTTASLVSQLPSARVWTRRTVAMSGVTSYSAAVPGVDVSRGTAPAPPAAPRHPLRMLDLDSFSAVHEDGTVGAKDIDLTIHRGQLVLIVGPVGAGKSSMLRAMAGIVHHTGALKWNGQPVTEPEVFLRPNQVGYVGQLPRMLSGTVADNIQLGHDVDVTGALATAQLQHDLAAAGAGVGLLIGHKGTRLSGGQLQRLALARALAPDTELLIADDISSALDVTTELDLWRALRRRGVTVIGSTSKRAALAQADQVVVLVAGEVAARGVWDDLAVEWGHLAG